MSSENKQIHNLHTKLTCRELISTNQSNISALPKNIEKNELCGYNAHERSVLLRIKSF